MRQMSPLVSEHGIFLFLNTTAMETADFSLNSVLLIHHFTMLV
ncbi:hypothetical protein LEP1GSC087_1640 [Leptospira interrogans serovar Bataviae str. L1111]|nr:hypothetical protein LEP1GSC087_1640 [Leptospira interrogans serovar Bataviae str. L1111]